MLMLLIGEWWGPNQTSAGQPHHAEWYGRLRDYLPWPVTQPSLCSYPKGAWGAAAPARPGTAGDGEKSQTYCRPTSIGW